MSVLKWFTGKLSRTPDNLAFRVHAVSARGPVRKDNQDHLLSLPELGFFCVADGMGGGSQGERASRWLCEGVLKEIPSFMAASTTGRVRAARFDAIVQAVNTRLRTYIREQGLKMMGTTVAAFLAQDVRHTVALLAHAGDSRVYRLRGGQLQRLTQDHTVGEEMSRKMTSRHDAHGLASRRNPLTHVLTRAVGTEFKVRLAWKRIHLRVGDRYLICSDGVHDMLPDEQIAALLAGRATPHVLAQRLESAIIAEGAGDNYSFVCIEVCRKRRRGGV